jgi:hypothetical protein
MQPHGRPMRRGETVPPVWTPEVAGGHVTLDEELAVLIRVIDVVVPLSDSRWPPLPHPTAKTSMAAPPRNVIAFLPL